MTEKTELGKIKSIEFGCGGYDDAMTGLTIFLGGDGWAVGDFKGTWTNRPNNAEWTEETQVRHWGEAVKFLRDLLKAAKVKSLSDLSGIPVEVTFDNHKLVSWRVLEEVL
jgi:hypothetical protein